MVAALHFDIAGYLEIRIAFNRALVRSADYIMKAASAGWIDVARRSDHHMGAADRGLVSATVKRFAQMDLSVFGELGFVTVAEQPTASHVHIVERTRAVKNAVACEGQLVESALFAANE